LLALGLPAGAPDLSFSGTGLKTTLVGSADGVGAIALQPDGKIVVAGSMGKSYQAQTVVVVRYLPDGHLDAGFGGPAQPGVVDLGTGSMISAVFAVAVDQNQGSPDLGDIVVAGRWSRTAPQGTLGELALARFKADGSLDASFGAGGVVVDPGNQNTEGVALAIQPDDKIVVLSFASGSSSGAVPLVERFNSDGSHDPSFGTGGSVRPFGDSSPTTDALALDPNGNILVARVQDVSSSSATVAVTRLMPDGQPDPSFGSQGVVTTTVLGTRIFNSAAGMVIDGSGRILVAGTAGTYIKTFPFINPTGFWVACYVHSGSLDPSFNHGAVEFVNFRAQGQTFTIASGVAVQPDGRVMLGGESFDLRGLAQEDIVLARLNPDGMLDESFGERGWDIPNIGSQVSGYLRSVLVQPDGNIVAAFTYDNAKSPVQGSEFGVARYMGSAGAFPPNSGTLPAGNYRDEFVSASGPTLDSSQVFRHFIWYNSQPSSDALHAAKGHGWDLEQYAPAGKIALHEAATAGNPAALDAITFPNLRPDVHVGLASLVVAAIQPARVTFVGADGAYTVVVPAHATQTAAAGESHVLVGTALNPSLELGPIREIILDSQDAFFYNLKALVIPGAGPLDDFVTVAPGTRAPIDVLDYATGGAAAAGLQTPLALVSPTGQPNLPGSNAVISTTNPNDIVYTNTLTAQPGQHPTDSFTYTVQDVHGRTATGTVYVTVDSLPVVHITMNQPAVADGPGWDVPKDTPGPLTGQINLADAEHDPIVLALADGPQHGTLKLTKVSDSQYSFSYVPLTSDIVFDDRFSVRVSDLSSGQNVYTSTDYSVAFRVGGRLLDFVLATPGASTPIDVLDYATGEAAALGLQAPLALVAPPGQPSLPGSETAISTSNPNDIVYTNTVVAQPGQHPTDSFTYTVQDVNFKTVTGTVYITIDAPPVFQVTVDKPAMEEADGWAFPHGTPGPLTGTINILDAEHDPVTLAMTSNPQHGTLNFTRVSDYQYSYSYIPPTTYAYDPETGVATAVSEILGSDKFTLSASDGYSSTDYTVAFHVTDYPPRSASVYPDLNPARSQFVVPENVGVSYYSPADVQPRYYNPHLDYPGLVHFAAPGVLWNQADFMGFVTGPNDMRIPQFDPLRAELATPPRHGLLFLLPDGSFNYTPDPGFVGTDTVTFFASDGYLNGPLTAVDIHVVPGSTSHPYLNAPVLKDVHYILESPELNEYIPPVFQFAAVDLSQSTRNVGRYPQEKLLIRPDTPTDVNSGQLQIKVPDLTNELQLAKYDRLGPGGFRNDLSLFYEPLDLSLVLNRTGAFDMEAPEKLDLSKIVFGSVEEVYVTITVATANAYGWLSNFASIVVRVNPSALVPKP
jgi:uncharacterized delta-60 repeat protein